MTERFPLAVSNTRIAPSAPIEAGLVVGKTDE